MNTKKLGLLMIASFMGLVSVFAQSNERGIDLYRAELFDAARLFFLEHKAQAPQLQAENYYYLGQSYFALGNTTEAASYYKKAQEIAPDYPFGYVGEGELLLKNGDKKGAEELFKKAAGLAKKNPAVQTAIAEAYLSADMYAEAEDALKKAEKINKRFSRIASIRGDLMGREGKVGESAGYYETALYFDPNDKEAYLKFARAYRQLNPNFALEKLEELVSLDPNYIPAYAFIGDINYSLGNYASAIKAYEKFISIKGVPVEQERKYAELLYFTNQYDKSLEQIEKVLAKDPNNLVMLRLKAYNNNKLENYETSMAEIKEFLAKSPEDRHIYLDYMTMARNLLALKQNEEAIAAFEKAETFENANLGEIYKEITTAYEGMRNYPEAIRYYEKYFAAEGVVPVVFDFLNYGNANMSEAGRLFTQLVDAATPADSIPALEESFLQYVQNGDKAFAEVVERSPDSPVGYLSRAQINSLIDSRQQILTEKMDGLAKPYYEQAIPLMEATNEDGRRNRSLIEAYNYLGSYYYVNDMNEQAGEYFKKILAVNPEHAGAKAVLTSLGIKF